MQDPHLQKRLQQVLKLNKEKWEEARDHAFKAVVVDNRMRVWWASTATPASRIGVTPALLYLRLDGKVDTPCQCRLNVTTLFVIGSHCVTASILQPSESGRGLCREHLNLISCIAHSVELN